MESGGISEPDRKECLRAISRFVMAYDDRLMSLVTEEFGRPKDAAQFSPETKRMKLLRDLIDGSTDDLHGLDYDLELNHIGVIAWGPRARSALSDLASALDRRLVWAPAEDDLLMAWVGSSSPPNETHLRVVRGSRPTGHAQLAVGSPGDGLAGFRRTHREAGEAHVVAKRRPLPVTLYEDVALEAFALRDEPAAREFVEHALGPLHVNGKRGDDLPETLRAYFAAGQNASSAAAALGVHEHTVPRRLQKIEELIGCPINDRRAELELALRLEALLTHNWGSGYGKSRL